jgi:hypothetical protein
LDHAAGLLTTAARGAAQTALDLLRPGRYLEQLRALPDLGGAMWEPVVVLLAEHGPSTELDEAIEDMRAAYAEHNLGAPDMEIEYARRRAAAVASAS